jgi:hypothetical protein
MAFDTLPDWLNQGERPGDLIAKGAAAGARVADNILAAHRISNEAAEFDAMLPLKMKALENETASHAIAATEALAKQENQNQTRLGFAALGQTMSEIGKAGDWLSAESEAKFFDTASKYPWVMDDPAFGKLHGVFDNARKADELRQAAELRSETALGVADISAKSRIDAAIARYQNSPANRQNDVGFREFLNIAGAIKSDPVMSVDKKIERIRAEAAKYKLSEAGANKLSPTDIKESLLNAQAAIARTPGKKAAILQRLRDNGIDTSSLK